MNEASDQTPKRAAPWRGRRRVADPKNVPITIRCTADDHAVIDAKAAKAGLKIGPFLRSLALGSPGPRAARRPPVERRELSRLLGQLGKVGSNINQLARGFHQTGVLPGFPEILAAQRDVREMRDALIKALGRGD
jgi:hypothetical protein